ALLRRARCTLNATPPTAVCPLSLHDALPICGDSASPKFAGDGDAHPGKVAHEPPALTALPSDVSGDDSAQPGKTNQNHHASADRPINDVPNNHPRPPPAANSLLTDAQHDDNG